MSLIESPDIEQVALIIPASGVGKRLGAEIPKQYITLLNLPLLEHTLRKFLALPFIAKIVVSLAENDVWFSTLPSASHAKIHIVAGGKERADSVLNGVREANKMGFCNVMVHDAARPCVLESDIKSLYENGINNNRSTILGTRVRDTMKRTVANEQGEHGIQGCAAICKTVDRNDLWHAFTPQFCKTEELLTALEQQLDPQGLVNTQVTDEASALELAGFPVDIINSSARNIKVTEPDDIELATYYLESEKHEY
ncbi:2-C-methyl-D-erythritol 4-phosphate cytidylyltransferase [Psychrosphaera haliotis]|nr:2-C-methyl-D-erythritol 4-phosphate cytidylyltransferase [Psychrosphaera haliotis]